MRGSIGLIATGVLVLALASGCTFGRGRLRGNGRLTEFEKNVKGYSHIVCEGSAKVTVNQNGEYGVTVIVEENLADYVKVQVLGDTLHLGWKSTAAFKSLMATRGLEFIVNMDQIESLRTSGSGDIEASVVEGKYVELRSSGSGDITVDALSCNELKVGMSGSGEIEVEGKCEEQEIRISGSGAYDGSSLRSDKAKVSTSGSGKARVWVRDTLEARTSGSGDISYRGNPRVDSHSSGSGRVTSID